MAAPHEPPPVVADVREGAVVAALRGANVPVEVRALQPADFVVGPVAVERKTVGDFASSVFDGRLFEQVARIRASYEQALLVLEGDPARLGEFQNPQSLTGALLSVSLDWGASVVPTADVAGTARVLATLRTRLGREPRSHTLRHKPRLLTPERQALFVVQGLPGVADILSERLLDRFGSVRRVMRASPEEMQRVPLMGPEKARRIADVLDRPWRSRQQRIEEGDADPP